MLSGFFVLGALLLLAFTVGFGTHWAITRAGSATTEAPSYQVLREAQVILEDNFLGTVPDAETQSYGAIQGVVKTYNDPYTVFIEPQPRELERDQLRGRFGGVGAQIIISTTGQVFLEPVPDKPAAKAGVQPNDELLAVDGQDVTGKTSDEVVGLVRGEVGTQVTLRLRRAGTAEPFDVVVTREEIENPSVEWRLLEQDPTTGYIALRIFGERTVDELRTALQELQTQGAQRLVLDLRHNPGGLLQAAVDVASQFLADGLVMSERKANDEVKTYPVRSGGLATDIPLVVLTDEATASASEIVAGALQDADRAPLIGRRTFGKGSVQLVFDLSDGSSIHVTVARWLTRGGQQIDGTGLEPDVPVAVENAPAGSDPDLAAALDWFARTPAPGQQAQN
jgi:carboxyl-terminal processing protease